MTRDEFDKKFGRTFFIKHNKWGHQMTNEEAGKAVGSSVISSKTTGATMSRSAISINNKK